MAHSHSLYGDVLVLATAAKKVFMDELSGEPDKIVLPSLQKIYNKTVEKIQRFLLKQIMLKKYLEQSTAC